MADADTFPIIVPLKRPIKHGEAVFDTLEFDEPDIGLQIELMDYHDRNQIPNPPSNADLLRVSLHYISKFANVPEEVASKIKESDMDAVNAAVEVCMGKSDDDKEGGAGNEAPAK